MPPVGVFPTLLLLISGVSTATVPPPANVIVSCQNVRTTVSWDYSDQQPHTDFRVNVSGTSGNWNESVTTEHQFDLSHFVWKSEENYKDFLYVTVTAEQGGSRSEGVKSNTFSFNDVKTVETRCFLDFPPVDVKVDESRATVSFPNPVSFYKELERTINRNAAPVFKYVVSTATNGNADFEQFEDVCMVNHDTCKLGKQLPAGVKCVNLTGGLFDRSQLVFREVVQRCAPGPVVFHVVMLAVILLFVLVLITTVVVVYICKTNAWTFNTHDKPSVLEEDFKQTGRKQYHTLPKDDFSVVSVDGPQRLLVSTEDSNPSKDLHNSSAASDQCGSLYMERQLSESSNQELEDAELTSGASGTDSDSADGSVKTESVSMGSEDDDEQLLEQGPYDRRHAVMLDMGDGDMATGYKGL
ncbi:interferon gamma receptor 1 precursor [Stegastes partitus]|uniref:Uncharacterized protein LOC103359570 n=2 Tax=Stegastes partitus TaxID=144197 RepID=A0A3B5A1N1_9TELE|nr:interferon gamma receptor 1 precursor [Stegastes partitus]